MVLHPVLRELLLRHLKLDPANNSPYHMLHSMLQGHFSRLAQSGNKQAKIENVYHALALGDPDPAIRFAYSNSGDLKKLLEAVEQAPTRLLDQNAIKQHASDAFHLAERQRDKQNCIVALVLYTWLVNVPGRASWEAAAIWDKLAAAYDTLPFGDREENKNQARSCSQKGNALRDIL